jgi:hypothetical protein
MQEGWVGVACQHREMCVDGGGQGQQVPVYAAWRSQVPSGAIFLFEQESRSMWEVVGHNSTLLSALR